MRITRRRLVLTLGACAPVVIAVIGVLSLVNVATRALHIDLNSGRIRWQWRVFGVLVSSTVEDTAFSRLADELSLSRSPPLWHLEGACRYWLRPTRPPPGTGGQVIGACERLTMIFRLLESDGQFKRRMVGRFLRLMRERKVLQMLDEALVLPDSLDKMPQQAGIPKFGRQAKPAPKAAPDKEQRDDRPPDSKLRDED